MIRRQQDGTTGPRPGFVSLVGAGPGDPELLTLRGLQRLQEADAVVHDRLIARELFAHCRPAVQLLDVGKTPRSRGPCQQEIGALLVRLALDGLRVVRLKGGDPYVFGRGGEEALALAAAGIPFEVVPGVSAALAAPAAAGIPVTHRGLAASVTIATGHGQAGAQVQEEQLAAYARVPGTLVFLMGIERLGRIVDGLLAHGRSADEPAALVRWATRSEQQVLRAPLGALVSRAARAGMAPPATLVVGPTVALADRIGREGAHRPGVPREFRTEYPAA